MGTSTEEETDAVLDVVDSAEVPLVSGASSAMKFSDSDDYPFFARLEGGKERGGRGGKGGNGRKGGKRKEGEKGVG